jgi:WD40 repeat protein
MKPKYIIIGIISIFIILFASIAYIFYSIYDSTTCVAISPDGSYALSGGYGRVCYWNIVSNEKTMPFKGKKAYIQKVAFSPDGKYAFAVSKNILETDDNSSNYNTIQEWVIADGALVRTYSNTKDEVYSLAVSSNGMFLATGGRGDIRYWVNKDGIRMVPG